MDKDIFFTQFGHLAQGPGGIKKLRDLILQLAVQGKLVEQDPDDEPASLLFERIAAYRDDLIRQKKIRKAQPFSEVEDGEKYFSIPAKWRWCRFGELGDWGAGATPNRKQSTFYGGTIPWFKSGELTGGVITSSEETVTEEALQKSSLRVNMPGDVMVAMYGATIGKTAVAGIECTTNQAVCACTPFDGVFNEYLHIGLKAYRPIFTDQGAGGAQPNISRVKIIHTPFPIPPLTEQKRIVAKVDELMGVCDELEAQQNEHVALKRDCVASTLHHLTEAADAADINTNWSITQNNFQNWFNDPQTVKTLRATILQLAVQGKLVPQDPNDEPASVLLEKVSDEKEKLIEAKVIKKQKPLPEINLRDEPCNLPRDWKWVRFGDLFMSSEYGTSEKAMATESSGVPVYAMGHIQNRELMDGKFKYLKYESDSLPKLYLKHKDLLFNRTNSYELVGKTAIYWGNDD
ncbi:restriction endonuclease subunit S, partial [Terasakiella sp.]|uniref:restriction endonuclease subunit S n=1 Tax=Terasakiella sp. TaxID=2034861 RepID=UPI003AA918C6